MRTLAALVWPRQSGVVPAAWSLQTNSLPRSVCATFSWAMCTYTTIALRTGQATDPTLDSQLMIQATQLPRGIPASEATDFCHSWKSRPTLVTVAKVTATFFIVTV